MLLIGDRVVLRANAPPEAEYLMFEIGDIELRASEPGRVREHGYQTTVERARERLAQAGVTAELARECAVSMHPALSVAYARGPAARHVARYLGPLELFQSDHYDAGAQSYRGTFVDLPSLVNDLHMPPAGVAMHALFLATLLEAEENETTVFLSTDGYTKLRKPGERTHRRPNTAAVRDIRSSLAELARTDPRPAITEQLPRADVIAFVRSRAELALDDDARALYESLERAIAVRDNPEKGPLAEPDLWSIETRLDTGNFDGILEAVEEVERTRGRTPGTTYLRARASLALRLEPPKLIAERVSALALSMTSFQELCLLAAEAWLEAGEPRRAMPYARDLVDAPGVDEGLLLRAKRLLARAVGAAPDTHKTHADSIPAAPRAPSASGRPPPRLSGPPMSVPDPNAPRTSWIPERSRVPTQRGEKEEQEAAELDPDEFPEDQPSKPPPLPNKRSKSQERTEPGSGRSDFPMPPSAPRVPSGAPSRAPSLAPPYPPQAKPARTSARAPDRPAPDLDFGRSSAASRAPEARAELRPPEARAESRAPERPAPVSLPPPLRRRPTSAGHLPVAPPPPLDLDLPPLADVSASFTLDLPGPESLPPKPSNAPPANDEAAPPAHGQSEPHQPRRRSMGAVSVETRAPPAFDPRAEPEEGAHGGESAPATRQSRPPPGRDHIASKDTLRGEANDKARKAAHLSSYPPPPRLPREDAHARPTPLRPPSPDHPALGSTRSAPPPPMRPPMPTPVLDADLPPASTEAVARTLDQERNIQRTSSSRAAAAEAAMHGASLPPFRLENPPPLLPKAPLLPKLGGAADELVEHLPLPAGLGSEPRSLDSLPKSVLEARVAFTLLARELGLDYRLKRGIELRADVSGLEAMQSVLLESFPDRIIRTSEDAYELRRHGALLSEILARRLDAEWIDISPNELGYWAMIVPPDTRVWPFGRIARLVEMGHKERDLVSYFFELQSRARGR